jgi:hypothetical protein
MSLANVATVLPGVQSFFTRYGLSTLLVIGNFGTLCNIVILSSNRTHRTNSCSLYLLAAAVFNLIAINFGLVTTLYALDHQDPATMSVFFCKTKTYITHVVFNVSRWLVVLACADRFALCHEQVRIRSWSSPRFARRAIISVTCIWTLIAIHVPIWQGIHVGECGPHGVYELVWSIYQIIIVGILPPCAMITFSFLTLKNLHSIRSRVQIRCNSTTVQLQPRDISMMRMVSAEIFIYLLTNSGHPIVQLYSTISDSVISNKSTSRIQIEEFVRYLTMSFLIYTYFCATFYIYVAASRSFRQDFKRLFTCCTNGRIGIESHGYENIFMSIFTRRHSRQLPAPQQTPIGF